MVAVHTAPAATFGFAVRSAAALLLAAFLLASQANASARLLGSETPPDIGSELPPVVSAHAGRSLQAAFDHTSPLINDNTVVFYEDSNFRGREHVFQVGNFANVPRNDRFSSARIGRNVFAEVFEDSNFRGSRTDVVIDVPTMERRGWNDVISSLKVKTRPAEGVALFVDVTNSDGSVVALQGRRTVIKFVESPADLTVSSLRRLGLRNDDLSEIHVPPGVTATVFRDNSFFGPSRFLPGPIVAKLTSVKFEDDSSANDRVSSIRIRSAADAFNSKVSSNSTRASTPVPARTRTTKFCCSRLRAFLAFVLVLTTVIVPRPSGTASAQPLPRASQLRKVLTSGEFSFCHCTIFIATICNDVRMLWCVH